jgi:Ca-activated chloride channel family protein
VAAGLSSRPAAQFSSGVNLVEVYATVSDQRGEPIGGLAKADFEVAEDGRPQAISTFAAGDFPLTVALALDRSFSMAGERLAAAKAAGRFFLGQLRAEDDATVIVIGSQVDVIAPLSTDRKSQFAALAALDAFGTTGLYDGVARAIDLTQPGKGRRALVILSDGDDRFSKTTADDVVKKARAAPVLIYPIALGRSQPPLFAELAAVSGGRSFHVRDARTLPGILESVARELRQQYLLGYTPARPPVAGSGEWRSIAVKVRVPGAIVRARDGYHVQ